MSYNYINQDETPTFINPPANNLEARNTQELLAAVTQEPDDYQQQAKARSIVQTAQQLDSENVYVGDLQPGDKLYAFATAVNGANEGYKGEQSYYYVTEKQLQTMIDHGLIDNEQKTINRQAISDYLGLPQGNKVDCLVEAVANERTAFIETRVGQVEWLRETEFVTGETYAEVTQRNGGGYQVHPDLNSLNQGRAAGNTLQIATIDGQTFDFRNYEEDNRQVDIEVLAINYSQHRAGELTQVQDVDTLQTKNDIQPSPEQQPKKLEFSEDRNQSLEQVEPSNRQTKVDTQDPPEQNQEPQTKKLMFPEDSKQSQEPAEIGKSQTKDYTPSPPEQSQEQPTKRLVFSEDLNPNQSRDIER